MKSTDHESNGTLDLALKGSAFPAPEDVHLIVSKNNEEFRFLGRALFKTSTDRPLPQAFWDWFRSSRFPAVVIAKYGLVFHLLMFVLILVFGVIRILAGGGGRSGEISLLIMVLPLSMLGLPVLVGRRIRIHFAKYLAERAGLVCPNCGYLLNGLPEKHTCPECGREYSFDSVRTFWLRWMASRRLRYHSSSDGARGK